MCQFKKINLDTPDRNYFAHKWRTLICHNVIYDEYEQFCTIPQFRTTKYKRVSLFRQ